MKMSDHEAAASEEDALSLKDMAVERYVSGDLQSALTHAKRATELRPSLEGLPEMVLALEILVAATPVFHDDQNSHPDYYKILRVDRFSHMNTIKKQYKNLALILHPDKSSFSASEEAFKLLGEAMQVLSDKVRRKEYDIRLRLAMQSEAVNEVELGFVERTFSATCCFCQFLHQFEKKFWGQNLMCRRCKKSFKAAEIEGEEKMRTAETRTSSRIRERVERGADVEKFASVDKGRTSGLRKGLERGGVKKGLEEDALFLKDLVPKRVSRCLETGGVNGKPEISNEAVDGDELVEKKRAMGKKDRESDVMTLFEMRMLMKKRKKGRKNSILKDEVNAKEGSSDGVTEDECSNQNKKRTGSPRSDEEGIWSQENEIEHGEVEKNTNGRDTVSLNVEVEADISSLQHTSALPVGNADKNVMGKYQETGEKKQSRVRRRVSKYGSSDNVKASAIEDLGNQKTLSPISSTTFHDFNKERGTRRHRKGQVLAMYDQKNGIPRQYALIDEVISTRPFEATLSMLQFHSIGDNGPPTPKGFHFSCGSFRVSHKVSINHLNSISHVMDCERAARHVYRVYPKKGSVWALHRNPSSESQGSNQNAESYTLCVILSSYSDTYGVSLADLEKVNGFKTIFRRQEIGARGVRCLGKQDIQLFSHQIPAKRLTGEKALGLPEEDCWELDPVSIPGCENN